MTHVTPLTKKPLASDFDVAARASRPLEVLRIRRKLRYVSDSAKKIFVRRPRKSVRHDSPGSVDRSELMLCFIYSV